MIKVLVVDDSALIRKLLTEIISQEPDMTLVGAAASAFRARDLVNLHEPDVITLDIEMPKMDGLTFLSKLMIARPTPVVMISSIAKEGADATLKALELGAVDFITKPKLDIVGGMQEYTKEIVSKIRAAAQAKIVRVARVGNQLPSVNPKREWALIALGASTGGTEAIRVVLQSFPVDIPGIVITQHMPAGFTESFANRLNNICKINVKEAEHGDIIKSGCAYLAPGGYHLEVIIKGGKYTIRLSNGAKVNGHIPSVDVMFNSCIDAAGQNLIAALMTGMGKDGAEGLYRIRTRNGYTIVQDEESCVVFGMPKEAIKLDAAKEVVPLDNIGNRIVSRLNKL
jgi:two-component system, chemotaxis family, protein-glutamate methylesterase/glutaminase